MFKKTIPVAVAAVLSLSAGAAVATQTFPQSNLEAAKQNVTTDGWRYVGGEAGWELVQPAYEFRDGQLISIDTVDRSTPKPSLASIVQERNAVTADGWQHVGGENEWDRVQYAYEFRQGQLVHAATCIYGAPGTASSKVS